MGLKVETKSLFGMIGNFLCVQIFSVEKLLTPPFVVTWIGVPNRREVSTLRETTSLFH